MVLRPVFCAAALIAFASPAAQPAADAIRTHGAAMFARAGAVGMVMAVVRGDEIIVQGFGETARGSKEVPGATSLVRIGSISKVLASDLMLKLAAEGRLQLTDPIQKHAPRDTKVPGASGRAITLLHLATHTSGLPRALDGAGSIWERLAHQKLRFPPGTAALYSNGAYDVLGAALAAAGGQRYELLLRQKTTQPLAMSDTTPRPTQEQCSRLMRGTAADPTTPCNAMVTIAASGGMYSTAADMAKWIRQQLNGKHVIHVQRSALASAEGLDIAGKATGIGLGWLQLASIAKAPEILQKTGGIRGFMSYVALVPARGVGVFVAVTRTDVAMLSALATSVNELAGSL